MSAAPAPTGSPTTATTAPPAPAATTSDCDGSPSAAPSSRAARGRVGGSGLGNFGELDPAAQALGLLHGGGLAGADRLEGVLQIALLHAGRLLVVVVDGAVIDELAVLVEEERLRGLGGAVGLCHGRLRVD